MSDFSNLFWNMDTIRKLLSDIKAKDNENFNYELEKNKLEEDVKESEELGRIGKKIKILEKHLQQKCKYGEYLKKQIENLNKTKGKYFRYGMYYKSILLN